MTPQSGLEIQGNFLAHPFAELLAEVSQAGLNGCLRVSDKDRKCVVYFVDGQTVFAVSNARTSRLFDILLRRDRIKKEVLVQIPNFSNDFELAGYLKEKDLLTDEDSDKLFIEQIEAIIIDILSWGSGDWTFSSLARVRDGLRFDINVPGLLFDYGRCMPNQIVLGRFRSLEETFSRTESPAGGFALSPDEALILSRTAEAAQSATELIDASGMPESRLLHALYTLWLCGLLDRAEWQRAISERAVSVMLGAKLALKKEAVLLSSSTPAPGEETTPDDTEMPPPEVEVAITLEEYLERVESADTYYDILGTDPDADIAQLKQAYFGLAKMFHPDRYHSEGGEILRRIQSAFTELAQAHETLKNPETREVYDYKVRKELADREKRRAAGQEGTVDTNLEQAAEHFERGFSLLMDDEHEAALPFLARAAHYAPQNARYRAYYGKALSTDEKQRHKAENEMQTALKLDPNNPTFRILLAEFFIQFNLKKRAEGELNRLLSVFPSNVEARDLLERLKK